MKNTIPYSARLSELFECICLVVQLSKTEHKKAQEHYKAIADWLLDPSSPLFRLYPSIYAQGSMAIGTEVKPLRNSKVDLDQVCACDCESLPDSSPRQIYDLVLNRLLQSGVYASRITQLPKCIRISYAHQFHLDVVPARLLQSSNYPTAIEIIDREKNSWLLTDPKEYIRYFKSREVVSVDRFGRLDLAASADPAPEYDPIHARSPLARVVQLLKRRRDIFYDQPDNLPASILLTTVAAEEYDGQLLCYDAICHILTATLARFDSQGMIVVKNPSAPFENLAAAWTVSDHHRFKQFISDFRSRLEELRFSHGHEECQRKLLEMFGESAVTAAYERYGQRLGDHKLHGDIAQIRNAPFILTPQCKGSTEYPPHKFYGLDQ